MMICPLPAISADYQRNDKHRHRHNHSENSPLVLPSSLPSVDPCRGGLELLFANKRNFKFSLPSTFSEPPQPSNINFLIKQLCDKEMKDKRKDLFIKDGTVYTPFPWAVWRING